MGAYTRGKEGCDTNRKLFRQIVKSKTGNGSLIDEAMRVLGVGKNTACGKMNGNRKLRADEIEKFRVEYNMTEQEVVDCFIKEGE